MSRSRRWSWFRENRGRHRVFRAGVFVVGLLLIVVGALHMQEARGRS